jgi:GNAT superfamily N-acetyltransferase
MQVKPVDKTSWKDFEALFKSKGAPSYCWCMAWRMSSSELKNNDSASRKKFIHERVSDGIPIGLLAYANGEPVAWCSVAPRETFNKLGGDEQLERVWSITCFFVKRTFRDQGMVSFLIDAAKQYARQNGAKYLEAYPVDPDSPSYRHMGFKPSFEKANFSFVKKAGTRRNVMVCKL